jgi:hypothetical protein
MSDIYETIETAKKEKISLFYNNIGSKEAYQLGVKHITSAEFLGYADRLPNGDLRIKKMFLLVDFEKNKVIKIQKGSTLRPIKLENA